MWSNCLLDLGTRGDVLPDNDCPVCPGFEDNELQSVLCVQDVRKNKTGEGEKH